MLRKSLVWGSVLSTISGRWTTIRRPTQNVNSVRRSFREAGRWRRPWRLSPGGGFPAISPVSSATTCFGGLIETSLREEGVNTAGLVVRKGSTSQFAFIAAEPVLETADHLLAATRPDRKSGPMKSTWPTLRQARVFHTDGTVPWMPPCLPPNQARQAGVPVVVDAGTLRDGMLELARLSDCFIVSESFARALTGDHDPRRACRMLSDLGPQLVGVTLGKAGYVAMAGGKWIEKEAYRVQAVDTTGCGDVFHAGFVYGLVHGWNTEKSLDLGAWAAAQVSLQLGGRSGIPTLAALRKKSENYP